jgi:tetratricopeptide (TPR) repeat protein
MNLPDWRSFALEEGVLLESNSAESRVVFWVRADRDSSFQYWERVGSVARAEVTREDGLGATAATSVRARRLHTRSLGHLWRRLRERKAEREFVLPDGTCCQQCGGRRTDQMLVWSEDNDVPIDLSRVKSRWPDVQRVQQLGRNLLLLSGVEVKGAGGDLGAEPQPPPPASGNPRDHAQQLLAAARQAGDREKEASALADLGVTLLGAGDARGAISTLESALALNRTLGDPARESDIIGNLGMAALAVGDAGRARELFEQELAYARSTGDRFAEKMALERLGIAAGNLREFNRAIALFEQALLLARQVGDRQQQANLLWQQGIQHAELGQRELAIARAEETITLFKIMGRPQAGWYGAHLQKFRMGAFDELSGAAQPGGNPGSSPLEYLGGSIVASVMATQSAPGQQNSQKSGGPGLLRMAMSATRAMASFIGSGLKTTPVETQRKRQQTCAACEHHTGMRCKICGCFTHVKSRMLHEDCPIGKWPE